MRWNWKTNRKVKKRTCYTLKVAFKTKKGYTSGERALSCGSGPGEASTTILKNKQSFLKSIKTIKKITSANKCSDKCNLNNSCQYYKWQAKKKTCWLMELSYKTKKGFSTA